MLFPELSCVSCHRGHQDRRRQPCSLYQKKLKFRAIGNIVIDLGKDYCLLVLVFNLNQAFLKISPMVVFNQWIDHVIGYSHHSFCNTYNCNGFNNLWFGQLHIRHAPGQKNGSDNALGRVHPVLWESLDCTT